MSSVLSVLDVPVAAFGPPASDPVFTAVDFFGFLFLDFWLFILWKLKLAWLLVSLFLVPQGFFFGWIFRPTVFGQMSTTNLPKIFHGSFTDLSQISYKSSTDL